MTVNYERKMVPNEKTSVDFEYDTLEQVLKTVEKLIQQYGKDAKIISRTEPYSNSDRKYMCIYTDEPETDEEMAKRIAYEEKYAKIAEERDAAEFKRLQEKFGAKK
jgi:cell fate regulator YaaT (PSP1 superfamily)